MHASVKVVVDTAEVMRFSISFMWSMSIVLLKLCPLVKFI